MVLFLLSLVSAYLPGVAHKTYSKGAKLDIYVQKLDSDSTQIPFQYYDLKFCEPESKHYQTERLGSILAGQKLTNSPYKIKMMQEEYCVDLCNQSFSQSDVDNFSWMVGHNYKASWVLDNLPAGRRIIMNSGPNLTYTGVDIYQDGFPIGFKEYSNDFIFNHMHIIVRVHKYGDGNWEIVGFLVEPLSIKNTPLNLGCNTTEFQQFLKHQKNFTTEENNLETLEAYDNLLSHIKELTPQIVEKGEIRFSYSVSFETSEVNWATRWDQYWYKPKNESSIHWISLLNSFFFVGILSCMVGLILRRNVCRDIATYNQQSELDIETETGWKQIRGQVFRPPSYPSLFSIMVGSGLQLLLMALISIFFACLGFISPTKRGSLLTAAIALYSIMSVFAGYQAGRIYRRLGGQKVLIVGAGTAMMFPFAALSIFLVINLVLQYLQSSEAVDFWTLLELILIWGVVNVPLAVLGSRVGFNKSEISLPCRTNKIPRPVIYDPATKRLKQVFLLAGAIPFGSILLELNFLMKSLWHHTLVYFLFWFLFLSFLMMLVIAVEMAILVTYVLLCKQEAKWWWSSFVVSGSTGLYIFVYAVLYYLTSLELELFGSVVVYFGYMLLASVAVSLITGSVGFLFTFIFLRTIYSLIKVD